MEVKRRTAGNLVKRLNSAGNEAELASAIAEIRRATKQDDEIRVPLADAGAVPLLSRHLLSAPPISSASSHENASAALLNMSISAREHLMSTPGILDALAHSVRPSSAAAVAQNSAATVFSLLSVEFYRPIIGSKRTLLSALISLLRAPDSEVRTMKDALKALFGVALYPLNRAALVDLGAVPVLFSLVVKRGRAGVVEDATAVIAQDSGGSGGEADGSEQEDKGERGRSAAQSRYERREAAVGEIREVEDAESAVRELAESGISVGAKKQGRGVAENPEAVAVVSVELVTWMIFRRCLRRRGHHRRRGDI
ncbi:hypothetical protein HPP92_006729 [Vanilla planifolia]|uniref:U-box domain-containing protein n=1 Tax=Vanilla planifolia TaxID=51239 RepID=A0A835RCJ9_VANPL|nr:hypothetical protein HPP92_006729 [Vanilla planifolia]